MQFTQYATAEAFERDVLTVLKRHAIENNLLYVNIGDGKIMLTVKDDAGQVLLVADRTPPHPLVLYGRDNQCDDETLAFFARSLFANDIAIDFVFAEHTLAERFIREYGKLSGKRFAPAQRLALSVTDHATPPASMAAGKLRLATDDDLWFLPYWCADFNVACDIGGYDLSAAVETAKRLVGQQQFYLWDDGVPVSMVSSHRSVTGCRMVSYVYTPPHLRGKGYAKACVYTLTRELITPASPRCALYVDCNNPISNRIYEQIGYQRTGIYQQYREVNS